MFLDTYTITIIISLVIILSYLFSMINHWIKIPSVLLLIGTGIGLHYLFDFLGIQFNELKEIVQILGVIGLILIVLEGSLELKISRDKIKVIRDSFFSSLVILVFSSLILALILYFFLKVDFYRCFIYAIPLSVISSAIVIPSINHLTEKKKDFLVYEVTLSDILGIMFFNFFVLNDSFGLGTFFSFFGNFVLLFVISVVMTILLIYLLSKIKIRVKFFIIFAVLVLLYSIGKKFHLSALLLIFVFGIIVCNHQYLFLIRRVEKYLSQNVLNTVVENLKMITTEMSFFIRTFFFILFGLSIDFNVILHLDVILIGLCLVMALILIRYLYLKFILKTEIFPEVLIIPRGLVTILLFYSIPVSLQIPFFNEGILFFVIIFTSILMMIGVMFYQDKKEIMIE